MLISDDQAWGDYSFMGHEAIETPRLDALARQSLTFTRGYVPDSLCRPSLVTIISGLYPHQHGIVGNDPPHPNPKLTGRARFADPAYLARRLEYLKHIDAVETLPDRLASLDYLSLQTGKWWEGNYRRGGFTHGMTHGDRTRGGRHGDLGLKIGREGIAPIEEFLDLSEAEDKPFFIWYAPFLPHTPHNPPQRLLDKYSQRTDSLPVAKYWAMCEWFDETCGDVLDALDERGLAENTIVMYVTDNGWINRRDASRYAPRSKRSPHEGGIRTPIMVRWPGKIEPRMDKETLVSSIDLVPTALAAVGLPADAALPGVDLRDSAALARRDAIFGEILEHDIVHMDDPAPSLRYRWVIEGDWKLIDPVPRLDEPVELYDLSRDPHEQQNLAEQHPERVRALRQRLDHWWAPSVVR
ncbi:sulfatase family protein [Roseimaritima sediminicola]|uniref:sulfatase family protein n=1 Tax=Roseimaritima sediminicola TaxID=2662066 RepID=UPI001F21DADC|nr:sulfatase [Roseimaritima sediminicola]